MSSISNTNNKSNTNTNTKTKTNIKKDMVAFYSKKPAVSQPVESTPVESQPVESTPVESKPVESTPVESQPVESTPVESTPVESTPVESTPVESTPVESQPVESKPVETQTPEPQIVSAHMFEMMKSMIENQQRMIEMLQQTRTNAPQQMIIPPSVPVPIPVPVQRPQPVHATPVFSVARSMIQPPAKPVARPHTTDKPTFTKKPIDETTVAPFDLFLEEDCPAGFGCPNSKNPLKCPKNHQHLGHVIKKGAVIPRFMCRNERPWEGIRCKKPECIFGHLAKRHVFLESFRQKINASS